MKRWFEEARELSPGSRAAFLDRVCAGDAEARAEIESLLAWDPDPSLLDRPADLTGFLEPESPDPLKGHRLGAYELIERIGEGGMGVVYRAARADAQYEKSVAVKILKHGLAAGEFVWRFRQERQTLASLEHPNIARLVDGGTTSDGRPYLVMEFVVGEPIDRYADERRLSIEARLELFRTVCAAVQYAHQNLIVHRDIKPDNVLVTAEGVPKLLDFGIAKLLDGKAPGADAPPTRLMTPEYASPEQVMGGAVSTATDVYALGVLLYQLLTGRRPYDLRRTTGTPIEYAICHEEPPLVSDTVGSRAAASEEREPHAHGRTLVSVGEIAARRSTTLRGLRHALAGDLDTIVRRAMHKDPQRRYPSAEHLAEDVRRHVSGLPVIARTDRLSYRASRFARRHAAAVVLGAGLVVTLLASTVVTAWQARIAQAERDRARSEAAKAERVRDLLQQMLASPNPDSRGRDVRVADILDEASRRTEDTLAGEPEVQAALLQTLSETYRGIGLLDRAQAHAERVLALLAARHGVSDHERGVAETSLGTILLERGELARAEDVLLRARDRLARAHPTGSAALGGTLNSLGSLRQQQGRLDEAEAVQRQALDMRRAHLGNLHLDVADSLNDLAVVLGTRGDFKSAEPLHREALALTERLYAPDHPAVASASMSLAFAIERNGNVDEAARTYQRAIDIRRRRLGNAHPDTAWAIYSYAGMLEEHGDDVKAESLAREVLSLRPRILPDAHPIVAGALYVLGLSLLDQKRYAAAADALEECLRLREPVLGASHWLVASARSALADALISLNRFAEAEPHALQGYEGLASRFGAATPRTQTALARVIRLYDAWKRPQDAARYRARMTAK